MTDLVRSSSGAQQWLDVGNLLTALERNDVIGALGALAPGERDALGPGLEDVPKRVLTASPGTGYVTVEEGGRWFVSPMRSLLEEVSALMGVLSPSDIT